jgi:hypothetical protein
MIFIIPGPPFFQEGLDLFDHHAIPEFKHENGGCCIPGDVLVHKVNFIHFRIRPHGETVSVVEHLEHETGDEFETYITVKCLHEPREIQFIYAWHRVSRLFTFKFERACRTVTRILAFQVRLEMLLGF